MMGAGYPEGVEKILPHPNSDTLKTGKVYLRCIGSQFNIFTIVDGVWYQATTDGVNWSWKARDGVERRMTYVSRRPRKSINRIIRDIRHFNPQDWERVCGTVRP